MPPPLALSGLLRRLSLPQMGLRLPKEQLCLSLASIGKLDLTPLELKENFNCNVIVSRTSQIASTCEPVELKMLAPGLRKLGSVAPIGQALDILAQRISSYSSIARTEAAKLDLLEAVLGLFSARDRWQRKLCLRPVLRKCLEESSAPLLARAIIASLRSGEPLRALDQRLQVLGTSYKEVGSSTAFQLLLELELQGSTDESITYFMGELSKHCITFAQSLSDEEFIELSSSTTLSKDSTYVDGLHRRLEPSTRNVPLDSLATLLCSGVPLNGALFESIVQTLSAVDESTLPHVDAMVSIVAGCCRRKIPVPPMLIRQLKESTLTLSCINTPGDLSQWLEAWTHVDPSARNTAILTKLKGLNSVENLMEEVDKLSNDAEDQFVASLLLLRGVQVGLFHGSLSTDAQTLSKLFGKVTNSIVAEVVLDYLVFLFPQQWRGDLPLQLLRMFHRCRVRDAGVVDSLLTAVTEIAVPIQPRDCALLTAILKENEALSTKHATLLKTVTDILHEDKGMELDTLPNKVLALAESGQPLSDETIFQLLRDATGKNWQPDDWAKVIAALVLSGRDVSPLLGKVDELVEGLSIAGCSLLLGAMASSAPLRKRALLKTMESLEKLLPFANPLPSLQALVRLNPSASEGTLSVIPLYLSRVGTMIPRSSPEDLCRGLSLLAQLVRIESSFEPQFQNTLRNFAAHFLTTLDSCSLAQVALVIKTFGEVDFIDSALFDVISRRLTFDAKTIKDPQTILQFLEALHVANVPQLDRFANPLVDSLHEVIDKVGETDLIAALRYLPTEANSLAMQQALGRISLSASTMGIDQLENLCSALIRLSSVTTLQEKGSSLTEECLSRLGKLLGEGVPVHPNSINAVFQSIAAYGRKGSWGEHEIDLLTARVSDSIAQYSAPALLTLTEGLTTLQCRNPKLIHIVTQRAAELAEEFSSSQLASILLQLSRLGAGGHPSIASLAEYVVDHCESFHRGCDITAILTAFGRMGHNNRNIYHVMAKRLHRRPTLHYLKREEVSLALNAFGAARYLDEGLFKALGNRVQDLIDEVDAPDIAMTLHSFTQVHLVNDNLFESLASRATEVAENFTPDGVIMTINALGKIDQQFTDMTDRLLDVLIPQLHQVEPSSVAGMLTALCLQEYNNAKHWGALSDYLCENVERLNAQGLKDLCLVMQTMTWREDRLLRSVGDQAVRLQMAQSMTGETARVVMDTMSLFLHHHQACREQLSESARSVSRETPPPLEGESLVASSRSIGRTQLSRRALCIDETSHYLPFLRPIIRHRSRHTRPCEFEKMNPALDLLKSITRDPGYVRRMQESDSSSMAKSWDNRFTVAKMPHYDAVNDRFCKFNLRRRKANETPAPKRSKLAANMLNMMGSGPKPVWGDINPREPLPPLTHKAHETPNPLASLNQASHPATTDRVPDAVSIANIVPQGQSLEVLFSKGRQRVIKLWDELGVPELDRLQFAKQHMSTPTAENVQALNDEIQRLLDRRNAAVQVEKAIEIREGFLYLLQELSDRYATTGMEKERAIRELNALVVPFRNASLDVVDAILKWRDVQKASTMKVLPYLWKGVSYLHKMVTDAYFLTFSRLGQLLDFDLRNNPLLDPRKELELAQAGKLPPVRRQKDNVRLKDLPRERMDRAERVLAEEAQRQATLNASRTNHGSAHDGMAYVEEEGYLENLVREEEEKQQLLVEEDVWLSAHEKEEQTRGKEERAAVKIQTCYRGYIARKLVTAKLTQKKAAIKMQTLARQFVAKLYTQRLRKQTLAAKRIQALHRGVSTRTAIGEIRHRHYCATTIQRVYRGHIGRKIADMMRYIRHCAVSIQRVYKGYRVRKAVQYFQSKMLAHHATTIQRCWRGYLVRRNPFYNPRKIEKVVTLQAWTRGNIDRAFAKQLLRRKRAAVKLQAWWRSVTAQRLASQLRSNRVDRGWQHRLRLATTAAILLQSAWRRFLACRRTAKLRAERNDTAAARALLAIAEEERREAERRQFLSSCATKIQAGWRGLQGRNTVKMIRYLSSLATKIQKVVRGRLGRLRAKARNLEYIRELSAMSAVPPEESLVSSTLALLGEREAQPLSQQTPVAEVIDSVEEAPEPLPPHSLEEPVVEDQPESAHDVKVEVEPARETSTIGAEPNVDGKNAQPTTDAPSAVELAPQEEVFPVLPNAPEAVTDDAEKKSEAATTITNFLKTAANRNEVSRKESRKRKAAASLNQQARHQEAVYAATIIARWVRNVFLRRQLAVSAKRQEIEVASKAHLQEKMLAASEMQNLVRRFILRRKLQAQKESMTFAAYRQALLQERQTGAVLIQALARRASARNLAAVAPKRDSRQNRAEQQERDYAAAVVQHAVLLHIPHIAAREKTISESTSVTAIAESQERSYAIKSLQHFLRRIQAKNAIQNLRKQRAIFVSQLDALAAIQESEFASPTADGADDSTVSPPASSSAAVTTPLVSPERRPSRSVINVTHAHKGQEVHVGFSPEQIAAAEHEHKVLPKDAPVRPQDVSESETDPEQELRERIRALEEKLAEMRRVADAEIKAEVDRRLREALAAQQQEVPAREPVSESPADSYPSSPEPASMAVSPACTSPQPAVVEPQSDFQQESTPTQPSSQAVESEPAPTVVVAPIPVVADELPREQPVHEDFTAVAVQEQEEAQPSVENLPTQAGDSELPVTDGTSTSAEEVHPAAQSEPVSATVQPAETHQTQSEVEVTAPAHEESNEATLTTEVVEARHSAEPQPVTENNATEVAVHNEEPVAVVPEAKSTEESAVAIQSLYRGHLDRRRVASTKAEKKQARAAQEKEAAVRIQCGYRQHTARNRFAAQKAKVQREREEKRLEAERQLAAQETHAKQADAAAKEKLRTQIENQSAAVIQRAYRCYNARFMLRWKKMERREQRERAAAEEEQRLTSNAAVKIQCFSRQATARTAVKELRRQRIKEHQAKATLEEIKHSAAITIQCAWRSYNARFELKCRRDRKLREQQDLEEARKKAEEDELARIQREEEERRLQEQQSKATLTMQLAWRSYNARFRREELQRQKSEKDEFILKSTSLEILQRLGRGALSRSQLARSYSEYLEAKLLQEQSDRLSSVAQPVGRAYFARAELGYQRQAAMLPGTTALNAIEEAIREASPEREHKSEPAPSTESQ